MADLPVACTLSPAALQTREDLLNALLRRTKERREFAEWLQSSVRSRRRRARRDRTRGGGNAAGFCASPSQSNRLDATPRHANPMGTLHGGILCDVADAAMDTAFVTTLAPDESFTTMSLAINFFRPVWVARLRFDARVVNRSKNNGYIECDIADPDGKRIAKAMSTCTVLRGEQAKTR
jgi:uncharacterized protein (TIGR00369 family)